MPQTLINIESLDMDARGVGHLQNEDGSTGKVIFVEGALPGERVSFLSFRRKSKWEAATLVEVHRESALRVTPKCPSFGVCGGCAMQHLEPAAQVATKQRVLEDNLKHIAKVRADVMMRPVHGPTWRYRYRARLSVRHVGKKGGMLVGFHERKSGFICDMTSCDVLPANVSAMLVPLRHLISGLSIRDQVPQLELAVGEGAPSADGAPAMVTALVMRIMAPLNANDETALRNFGDRHGVQWWLQTAGPDSAAQFHPAPAALARNAVEARAMPATAMPLHYSLPEFGIVMPFKPTDFTQVNHQINRILVARAVTLLDVQPDDRVADLFCGLGNFTLPLATRAREVVGIEGSAALTTRATENAAFNGLAHKTGFSTRNLFELSAEDFAALGRFDRMLIDPPRDGAAAVCEALATLSTWAPEMRPARIVYVSCSPSTLARDAGTLVHKAGYILRQAGVVNMFPHTAHVESIAVFDLAPAST